MEADEDEDEFNYLVYLAVLYLEEKYSTKLAGIHEEDDGLDQDHQLSYAVQEDPQSKAREGIVIVFFWQLII